MTLTHAAPATETRRPAWLLVLTLPIFIAYVVVAVATIAQKADTTSAELTPAQISDLGVLWVLVHVLWVAPPIVAVIALSLVARKRQLARTATVPVMAGVGGVLAAAYLVVQLLAFGVGGETWGDSRLYPLGVVLSLAVGWCAALPATILVAVVLARSGVSPKTCWTVAALTALYFVFEVLTYLPALFGPATLDEAVGLPPFLIGFFWAALGGALHRARVPSGE